MMGGGYVTPRKLGTLYMYIYNMRYLAQSRALHANRDELHFAIRDTRLYSVLDALKLYAGLSVCSLPTATYIYTNADRMV